MSRHSRKPTEGSGIQTLADAVVAGDRRALARAITLVESSRDDHRAEARTLLAQLTPRSGNAIRIGISGVPGVGKSSFIEAFGKHIIGQGHRLAVLAVDPSSGRTGGSVLGDKTRMAGLATNSSAFIRPSPSAGTLGGVARRTRETIVLCEAAGFDVVLVETVGVGQSEYAVADMTDMFVLLMLPGGGDELQGMKRGIMELADLVLVNKADGELKAAANRAAADYANALRLLKSRIRGWTVPVETCSAVEGKGIAEAWEQVEAFRHRFTRDGSISRRRGEQALAWLWNEIREGLNAALMSDQIVADRVRELESGVVRGETAVGEAASEVVELFLKRSSPGAGAKRGKKAK
jgi:LAO/AO transport system kinase